MAVYTPVSTAELERWLSDYAVGDVLSFEPIEQGIENTNYFLSTTRFSLVLTLFERLAPAQLPFYLHLMEYLARQGSPCPAPQMNRHGALFGTLNGRPAALVTRLSGHSVLRPNIAQCFAIGAQMAQLHLNGRGFAYTQPNQRGFDWWAVAQRDLQDRVTPQQRELLDSEITHQRSRWPGMSATLPSGPVHADLFRDNVLFEGDRVSGIIDFYFAATELLLFDVAVTVNDWCIHWPSGAIDVQKAAALLTGYTSIRPVEAAEVAAWTDILRAAALRFWLSRLHDQYLPRVAQLLKAHDPAHFERILRMRREETTPVVALPH